MKINNKLICIFIAICVLGSCSKDLTEEQIVTNVNSDSYGHLFKSGPNSEPVPFGDLAEICFLSSEQIDGNTKFTYQVNSGTKPYLSHWNLLIKPSETDQGVQEVIVLECSEIYEQGKDGSLKKYDRELVDLNWVKFDEGYEDGEVRTVSFTLEGIWFEGDVDGIAKGGKDFAEAVVTGPVQCDCGNYLVDARDNGKKYKTVKIGDQCWMAKNLAYLPSVSPPSIGSLNDPNCYVYGYEENLVSEAKATDNFLTYGVLYSWHAAMNGESSSDAVPSGVQGICPSGWHLPSDSEWQQLKDYLTNNGFSGIEGSALTSTSGWYENGNGTDDFNFAGLPGGYLDDGANDGFFTELLESCIWTSSTRKSDGTSPHAYFWNLYYKDNNFNRGDDGFDDGYSVRCIKD